MKSDVSARFLRSSLEELKRARQHLAFSHQRVLHLGQDPDHLTAEEMERMEAFTSRFARLVDLLTQKVLRALFDYELEPVETVTELEAICDHVSAYAEGLLITKGGKTSRGLMPLIGKNGKWRSDPSIFFCPTPAFRPSAVLERDSHGSIQQFT